MFVVDASVNPAGPSHAWRAAFSLMRVDLRQGLRKHLGASTHARLAAQGRRAASSASASSPGCTWGLIELITYTLRSPSAHPAELLTGLGASLWAFLLFVMLSGGLVRAIVVLHEQDDSSLLLSSPVSPRAILAARLFGNALQSCLVDGFIIIPYLDVLIFGWRAMAFSLGLSRSGSRWRWSSPASTGFSPSA